MVFQHLVDFLNNQSNYAPQMFPPITTQQQRQSEYVTVTLSCSLFKHTTRHELLNLTFLLTFITVQKFIFCGMKVYDV